MNYKTKEIEYLKCFFNEVYEIAMAQSDEKITATDAISKIHALIAVIEDLTIETPIVDLEETYLQAFREFDIAKKTYVEREMDLDILLTEYHKEHRK